MSAIAAGHASHDLLPGWLLLVIYVTGFVITARIVFMTTDGEDPVEDRIGSVFLGILWPVALAVAIACGLLALPTLGAKTKRDRLVQARAAEQEHRRVAARTAELEAENERLRRAMGES